MNNFSESIQNRLKELEETGEFEIVMSHVFPGHDEKKIKAFRKKHPLPDELVNFYQHCDGTAILVFSEKFSTHINCRLQLPGLNSLFSKKTGETIDLSHLSLEDGSFIILDWLGLAGNNVLGMLTEEGKLDLYLLTFNKHLNKLNLSFDEYLEKSVYYLGVDLWQQFFINDPTSISDYYLFDDTYYEYIEKLKITFPEETFNKAAATAKSNSRVDYRKKIQDNLSLLKSHGAEIRVEDIPDWGAPSVSLMKAQESLNAPLPDNVIAFYSQVNGLDFSWEISDDLSGSIQIVPIGESIGGKKYYLSDREWNHPEAHKNSIWMEHEKGDGLDFLQANRLVERYFGDSGFTSFNVEGNMLFINYAVSRESLKRTTMPLGDYLDIHLELMGLWHWLSITDDSQSADRKKAITDKIKLLSPGFDPDRLIAV